MYETVPVIFRQTSDDLGCHRPKRLPHTLQLSLLSVGQKLGPTLIGELADMRQSQIGVVIVDGAA